MDLEPGTMDSVRSGPYGQVQLDCTATSDFLDEEDFDFSPDLLLDCFISLQFNDFDNSSNSPDLPSRQLCLRAKRSRQQLGQGPLHRG